MVCGIPFYKTCQLDAILSATVEVKTCMVSRWLNWYMYPWLSRIAQLPSKQSVSGSNPLGYTIEWKGLARLGKIQVAP